MAEVTASQVKELRDRTGAPMLACRNALRESGGDIDASIELLRARGEAQAAKRAGREANNGGIDSYIHSNGQLGVLVEVNCETDFVARNEDFKTFVHDLALHIAAANPVGISDEDIPAEDREREERIATEQALDRPENVRERIVSGKLDKWLADVVLLRQKHVNEDKYSGQTIEDLRAKLAADTGENIVIRRFARFAIGT
ncbi:MAG: elongation factor Ts [Solirubrobacteraceae bacterium]|jgi:elongation factor Ts|nr:elongation factor Ts [Solirubrobacteraceae bacterium]